MLFRIPVLILIFLSFPTMAEMRCSDVDECQQRWWRVQSWLEENARFKVKEISPYRLEAKATSPANKNRLEYRVERKVHSGGETFTASAKCRSNIGCPSSKRKLTELEQFVMAPLSAAEPQSAESESEAAATQTPIELWVADSTCGDQSKVHHLRHSWSGVLYEVECIQKQRQTSRVVRCRGEKCKELK